MRIVEKDPMERMTLQELMDRSVRDIKHSISRGSGQAEFSFKIPANIPKINEYDREFVFQVNFSGATSRDATIARPDLLPSSNVRVKYKGVNLTFSNSVTHMSEIGGEEGYMTKNLGYPKDVVFSALTVYGTIARILMEYLVIIPDTVVQGISFITAHSGLVRPYIILCKEAEKRGKLIWANPNSVSRSSSSGSFVLLSESVIMSVLTALKKEGENR